MKITADTMLFVVNNKKHEGLPSHLTLEGLVNAVKGGMKIEEVSVFTGIEEANEYSQRIKLLCKGNALLSGLDTEKLTKLVAKIESDEIDDVLGRVLP